MAIFNNVQIQYLDEDTMSVVTEQRKYLFGIPIYMFYESTKDMRAISVFTDPTEQNDETQCLYTETKIGFNHGGDNNQTDSELQKLS